jgi:predicted nucleic acid-binding protein
MAGILFDTSIYIAALRQGETAILNLRWARRARDGNSHPLWLSAVVLSELLVGARDNRSRRQLLEMEKVFTKLQRILVPMQSDWTLTGQVLARVGEKYGYEQIGRARLTNDALIAISAARHGITVWTNNAEDFKKIVEFRPVRWEDVSLGGTPP